jgi:hypothetical protein
MPVLVNHVIPADALYTFTLTYFRPIQPHVTTPDLMNFLTPIAIATVIGLMLAFAAIIYPIAGRIIQKEQVASYYSGTLYGDISATKKGNEANIAEQIETIAAKINLSIDESVKNIAVASLNSTDGIAPIVTALTICDTAKELSFNDASGILKNADSLLACSNADAVVLVIPSGARVSALHEAIASLEIVKANLLGVVVSKAS